MGSYANDISCPHCDFEYPNSPKIKRDKKLFDLECVRCLETFEVIRHYPFLYSTSKLENYSEERRLDDAQRARDMNNG